MNFIKCKSVGKFRTQGEPYAIEDCTFIAERALYLFDMGEQFIDDTNKETMYRVEFNDGYVACLGTVKEISDKLTGGFVKMPFGKDHEIYVNREMVNYIEQDSDSTVTIFVGKKAVECVTTIEVAKKLLERKE